MSNPIRYTVELPCNFGDTVYILNDQDEIIEDTVCGFLVVPLGIAIETDGKHKSWHVFGADCFACKSDAIGEQVARSLSPKQLKTAREERMRSLLKPKEE